jgi:hypothetical protein
MSVIDKDQAASTTNVPVRSRKTFVLRLAITAGLLVIIFGTGLFWHYSRLGKGYDRWQSIGILESRRELTFGERANAIARKGTMLRWRLSRGKFITIEQSTGTVTYTVKKGGPFIVNVPGGRIEVVGTEFKVEVNSMSKQIKQGTIGATALAIVIVTGYQGRVLFGNDQGDISLAAGEEGAMCSGEQPSFRQTTSAVSVKQTDPGKKTGARKFANKAARQKFLKLIEAARIQRESLSHTVPSRLEQTGSTLQSTPDERPAGSLDKEYIQSTIKEALPLVKKCYELVLHEEPTLSGKLTVNFTIAAEPEVGGVVELVDIEGNDRIARQPTLRECLQETIYSLEFPEPKGGGTVNVTYPFIFRQSNDKPEWMKSRSHQ